MIKMIESIYINNFKSLIDFKLDLTRFNCLIGLNGSGKSTVLQAIDFLAQLMSGRVDEWLSERHWNINDVKFKLEEKQNKLVNFAVTFALSDDAKLKWEGKFSQKPKRCRYEKITRTDADGAETVLLSVTNRQKKEQQYNMLGMGPSDIDFEYSGSILSQLSKRLIAEVELLAELKEFMAEVKSLDLLSPYTLKDNSRAAGDIGLGGERFPGFLQSLSKDEYDALIKNMHDFYPQLDSYVIRSLRGGVKRIVIKETCGKKGVIDFDARHINDGTLRMLAILAQTLVKRSIVMFDEIENGINPELIMRLITHLVNCNAQVIITTHSPMILNYIPMEVAKDSIKILFKRNGETRAKKFLDLPETARKMEMLSAGEIFVDTDLTGLSARLASMEADPA